MAKATKTKAAPATKAAAAKPARKAEKAAAAAKAEVPPYSIALAAPGDDVPENGRRIGCPNCGAKHDVVPADPRPGQGGTWSVPDFQCLAPCGYTAAVFPVG